MNPTTVVWKRLQQAHEFDVYPKRDITLVRGRGSRVWDSTGKEYIDCAAGHGVASLGHCHPAVVAAIRAQADTLITCPGTYYNDRKAEALEKLIRLTPAGLDRAFLCNSGAEAVEGALKVARFTTGKTDFVAFNRAYHGRTLGALSVTFNPSYREPFAPLVPGVTHVPLNRLDGVEAALTDRTAAVIIEVIQGEGGVHLAEDAFLRDLRALCTRRSVLLIIDEIQSGFARTGTMFACQHAPVTPDILCVAKAIAGGVPMGAFVCADHVAIPVGRHGSTFGGNPLACAAASAAMDVMVADNLADQAAAKGTLLVDRLQSAAPRLVRTIRGRGLMLGLELRQRVKPYLQALLDRGVITLPAGPTVLRLLPPVTISGDDLTTVVDRLIDVLDQPLEDA